jgi:hypothetical protein
MKTIQSYIKILVIIVNLTLVCEAVYSQGMDSRSQPVQKNNIYLSFSADPAQVGLLLDQRQKNVQKSDFISKYSISSKNGTSVNLDLEFGYFMSKFLGITIGAGYSSSSTSIRADSSYSMHWEQDLDNENVQMLISGKGISEEQKTGFLSFPVCLALRLRAGEKFGFYLSSGVSFNIPVTQSFKGSGKFTYRGVYSAYNVIISDVPEIGFGTDVETSSSGNLKLKPVCPALVATGGVTYLLNKKIQLCLGAYFNKSIGNISDYEPKANFELTTSPDTRGKVNYTYLMNPFLAGGGTAGFKRVGASVRIRFYLN